VAPKRKTVEGESRKARFVHQKGSGMTNILIEDIDSNELLPKTLNNWNDPNLVATYQYCKSQKLKTFIETEFWWRSEMLQLHNI
jgi:hypothetical protein